MTVNLRNCIKELVQENGYSVEFPEGWDKDLPSNCCIELTNSTFLTITAVQTKFVANFLNYETNLTTTIVFEIQDSKLHILYTSAVTPPQRAGIPPEPQSTTQPLRSTDRPQTQQPANSRDPNIPPDFEDEFQLRNQRNVPRGIDFDPDSDLYPMGLKHPSLDPLGDRRPRLGPFNPGTQPGMSPSPFGSGKPPGINYDPTSPFDQHPFRDGSPGFGGPGGFGGSGGSGGFGPNFI